MTKLIEKASDDFDFRIVLPIILDTMESTTVKSNLVKERKVKGKVEVDIQKCKGCEICTTACKEDALSLSDTINIKGYRYIIANNDLCTGCVNCALVCPDAVITVYRTNVKKKKVDITPANIREEIKAMVNLSSNGVMKEPVKN